MTKLTFILLFWQGIWATQLANAADSIPMPPQVSVQGETLRLNGAGTRKATLFKVKVYDAGLYLPRPSNDARRILDSSETKIVRLRFLRSVSEPQVKEAWKDGFGANCAPDCQKLQGELAQFLAKLTDAKEGDVYDYIFTKTGVKVLRNGKEVSRIGDPKFGRAVLATWLGSSPPSMDLKFAMLGIESKTG